MGTSTAIFKELFKEKNTANDSTFYKAFGISLKEAVCFFLLFAIILALIFYPITFFLKSNILGMLGVEDASGTIWLYWAWKIIVKKIHTKYLSTGFSPLKFINFIREFLLVSPRILRMGNYTDFVIMVILEKFMPFPVYHNIRIIVTFILNAFCFFLLLVYLIKDRIISFLLSIVFALSPFFLICSYFGWLEQIFIFPVPLAILFFLKTIQEEEERYVWALFSGIFWALATIFYMYYGLFTGIIMFILLVTYVVSRKIKDIKTLILSFIVIAGTLFVITFPITYPYISLYRSDKKVSNKFLLLNKKFPNPKDIKDVFDTNILNDSCSWQYVWKNDRNRYIPPVILIALILSLLFIHKTKTIPWYLLTLLFYAISLGPYIKSHNKLIEPLKENWIYNFLYQYIPFFPRFQWPSRVQGLIMLFSLVIIAYTLKYIKDKYSKNIYIYVNFVIVAVFFYFVFAENILPPKVTPFYVPYYYKIISKKKEKMGIIELPFNNVSLLFNKEKIFGNYYGWQELYNNLYYQTIHQKKVFENFLPIKEYPGESENTLLYHRLSDLPPLISYFCQISTNPTTSKTPPEKSIRYFLRHKYKVLAVHTAYIYPLVLKIYGNFADEKEKRMYLKKALEIFPQLYINKLEKDFGPPIAIDYEYMWKPKNYLRASESETKIRNFELKKYKVYFFRLNYKKAKGTESKR